ncbi:hypothetical protein MD588_11370 [Photobacterium sp. SDRW27]|uniref:hypothetical protein n=1 Tax=Photobacterium obscurum TaxID=2829490 RepID=UPI002243CF1B|nr:hypothetical protein [Photobacterium obscurum]MCW8329407.1 hypothetical protein [Photobacterium obscurum]
MAITVQLSEGTRFFDNGREIIAVSASYAPTYLKSKAYAHKEVFEVNDLAKEVAAGRAISFWSDSVQSVIKTVKDSKND